MRVRAITLSIASTSEAPTARADLSERKPRSILKVRAVTLSKDSTYGVVAAQSDLSERNDSRLADKKATASLNNNSQDGPNPIEEDMPLTATAADNGAVMEEAPSAFSVHEAMQELQQQPEPRPPSRQYSVRNGSGRDEQVAYLQAQPEQQVRRSSSEILMEWQSSATNTTTVQQESPVREDKLDSSVGGAVIVGSPSLPHFDAFPSFDIPDFDSSDMNDLIHDWEHEGEPLDNQLQVSKILMRSGRARQI
jgi:hypothetical protein